MLSKRSAFLGRLTSSDGYSVGPKNVTKFQEKIKYPTKSITELRGIVGLGGYFCPSMIEFRKLTNLLYELIKSTIRK